MILAVISMLCFSYCQSGPENKTGQSNFLETALVEAVNKINGNLDVNSSLAVLNFTSDNANLSNFVTEELINLLVNLNKFDIVDRQKTDTILLEQNFQMSGNVGDSSIQKVGNMLGAKYIITGSLTDMGNTYRLIIYALDVTTAARRASSSMTISTNDPSILYLLTDKRPKDGVNIQNQKKYIFDVGFKNYTDYGLVSRTIENGGFRETVIKSAALTSDPSSLLYQYGFNFYDKPIKCNPQSFSDIINIANTLDSELYNKGYNIGYGLTIIVDDGISARVYKYVEYSDGAFFDEVADRKPY
jgi:TolB-like protein